MCVHVCTQAAIYTVAKVEDELAIGTELALNLYSYTLATCAFYLITAAHSIFSLGQPYTITPAGRVFKPVYSIPHNALVLWGIARCSLVARLYLHT